MTNLFNLRIQLSRRQQKKTTRNSHDPNPKTLWQQDPRALSLALVFITHVIPEDQEPMSLDPHDELLRWRY